MNTVIYATKTGHSRKIAMAIAGELNCSAQNITENPNLSQVDVLFLVGGIYGNQSLPELLKYVEGLTPQNVKKVVLITSSCSKTGKQTEVRKVLERKGILVDEEEFTCQGSFLVFGMGHPNKKEIGQAVDFASGKTC